MQENTEEVAARARWEHTERYDSEHHQNRFNQILEAYNSTLKL